MVHIKRIDESGKVCEEMNIEKLERDNERYIVKRLYVNRRFHDNNYEWKDEGRTFDTIEHAERYIKQEASYMPKNATGRFMIVKEMPIEMVNTEE